MTITSVIKSNYNFVMVELEKNVKTFYEKKEAERFYNQIVNDKNYYDVEFLKDEKTEYDLVNRTISSKIDGYKVAYKKHNLINRIKMAIFA